MADEDDDKVVSQRRMRQAWEEGRIPIGRDLAAVAGVGAAVAGVVIFGNSLRSGLVAAVRQSLGALDATPFATLPHLAVLPAGAAVGICAAAAVGATVVTLVQTKGTTWFERVLPDLTRLASGGRIASVFSGRMLVDIGLSTAKVLALAWAAWSTLRADFLTLPKLLGAPAAEQLAGMLAMCMRAGGRMLLVAAILAGVDVAVMRIRFTKSVKVTRQEAKHEAREDEGDPLIKGKRKARHRELSRGRARVEVPRADALLVNPTHIAIALRYRRDEGRAPRVIAKGKGALAEYMRELAHENGIPIVQDIPLARLLYRKVKVGREVPASTFKAIAAILAFVYRITGRQPGGRGVAA